MVNFFKDFQERICKRKIRVAVVGLGYVGLPLAIEFAKKGFNVFGVEVDKDRLNHIKKKESYITDISNKELKKVIDRGHFRSTEDFGILKTIDVVVICVPTPLKRKYYPDISYVQQAVKLITRNMKKPSLVILESTTYPGTTEEIILPLLEKHGLKHNKDFYLCFSPERIDPGNKIFPVNRIPKVVGGLSAEASKLGVLFYRNIIDKVIEVSSARTAETVKLLENTFRLVNISLIDELTMMCHKMNLNIWEVIAAASTKPFGFMPFYPGPGVGGFCIPKDPLYLYWKAKHFGFHSRFIKLASDIINYMPAYVVERLIALLKNRNIEPKKAKILIVGVTYKKDVKDLRKSPSIDIIDILQKRNIKVSYFDPFIPYLKVNHINLKPIEFKSATLKGFDCVVIATDHSNLDYDFILNHSKLIFDARGVYRDSKDKNVVIL